MMNRAIFRAIAAPFLVAWFILCLVPSASALQVSSPGGFYPGEFAVDITAAPGSMVFYTLDSTDPRESGARSNGSIFIRRMSADPSPLAENPETSLYPFTAPNTTLKATVLRIIEVNGSGSVIADQTHTYFIGYNATAFTVPVFSVVINPEYMDDDAIGMYVKGATYYTTLAARGGNPADPFRAANWNNDSLRWPAHWEMFTNGTSRISDPVVFYPSGRWSAALEKKSFKVKYDKALGPSKTSYPFFGSGSVPSYTKLRFRQGSQDWAQGIGMRDCLSGEIIQGMNVEAAHCAQGVLFINGEYWGSYNLHEDFDNKMIAAKYNISKDDVVILEQDGLISDGSPTDNQPYFELRDWVRAHDLSDPANYAYFESKVNTDSLIDYVITHQFFENVDFPNDHRFWRNKNPASQVSGTPYDGRWYFEPKDRDQTMGLYDRIVVENNTIQWMLDQPNNHWGSLFFKKAMENPGFRQRFIQRNQELLNTKFSVANMNATIDRIAASKRTEMQREHDRWGRPWNMGWWDSEVVEIKRWLQARHDVYPTFLAALNATQNATNSTNGSANFSLAVTSIPAGALSIDGTSRGSTPKTVSLTRGVHSITVAASGYLPNTTTINLTANMTLSITLRAVNTSNQSDQTCYRSVGQLPVTCSAGSIASDTFDGSCRIVVCGGKQVKACDKGDGHFVMYNQVRNDAVRVCFGDPSYGGICMTDWGYMRATKPFAMCTGTPSLPAPVCGNNVVESGEECDGSAPVGYACEACRLKALPVCGNGIVESGEECDGGAPAGYTCNSCGLVQSTTTVTVRLTGVPSVVQQALGLLGTIPGLQVVVQ